MQNVSTRFLYYPAIILNIKASAFASSIAFVFATYGVYGQVAAHF
jgi:hypothetical protein